MATIVDSRPNARTTSGKKIQASGLAQPAVLATCYHQMGEALAAMGRSEEAMFWFEKGRDLREAIVRDHPDITMFRTALANSHDAIGFLLWAGGRPALGQQRRPEAARLQCRADS